MEEGSPIPKSEIRNPKSLWLIVGLGNPGEEYAHTYHNVGFRVVELIGRGLGIRIDERCGPALVSGRVGLAGQTAVLVLPQTYMNRSGEALPPVFERFESAVQDVIIVYDDVALPLGRLRLRQRGSAGGHNGVKSLISTFGSDEFLRVRVGIRPGREIGDVREFVLSQVVKSDRALLDQAENIATKAVESLLTDGIEKAMTAYNGIDLREDQ